MKLISGSSITVTWNDQVADWFTLYLTSDQHLYQQDNITGNNYTFTDIPASSYHQLQMQAVFDERLSLLSDIIINTVDSKLSSKYKWISFSYCMIGVSQLTISVNLIFFIPFTHTIIHPTQIVNFHKIPIIVLFAVKSLTYKCHISSKCHLTL